MATLEDVIKAQHKAISAIQAYSQSQQDQWVKLPYLALQAHDGISHDPPLRYMYQYGLLNATPGAPTNLSSGLFVDLETGKIVRITGFGRIQPRPCQLEEATDRAVLQIDPAELNAYKYIALLKERLVAMQNHPRPEELWRLRAMREYGISPTGYHRKSPISLQYTPEFDD